MLQCGLFRSNFSLAIVLTFWRRGLRENGDLERVAGIEPASSAWKAAALPLCYTRVSPLDADEPLGVVSKRVRPNRLRVVGEAGLEPAKAYARGFTVPPLCHSGHSPSAKSIWPAGT